MCHTKRERKLNTKQLFTGKRRSSLVKIVFFGPSNVLHICSVRLVPRLEPTTKQENRPNHWDHLHDDDP